MLKNNWLSGCSLLIAVGSFLAAVVALVISWDANSMSREAYKRSSGRMLPLFTVKCETSHLLVTGESAVEPETILVGITNDGSEAIEAIRYEILMDIIWSGDRAKNQPIKPSRISHEFRKILQPKQATFVDIAPDVAAHIKTLKVPKEMESFWTPCSVAFSAKIVGSTYYASATDESESHHTNNCSFGVTWESRANAPRKPLNFGVYLTPKK